MRAVSTVSSRLNHLLQVAQKSARSPQAQQPPAGDASSRKIPVAKKPPAAPQPAPTEESSRPQPPAGSTVGRIAEIEKQLAELQVTDAEGDQALAEKIDETYKQIQKQLARHRGTDAKDDASFKRQVEQQFLELQQAFDEFQAADAAQDAKIADRLASLNSQLEQLLGDEPSTDPIDDATQAIESLTERLGRIEQLLEDKLGDDVPPPDSGGGGSDGSGTQVTNIEITLVLEGFSKRLDDLTQKFDDLGDVVDTLNDPAAMDKLFARLNVAMEDALNSQQALQEARSQRQSTQLARMISNLTIQVQASVNLFRIHESTLTRGMQDMTRGAGGVSSGLASAFSPQLLTYALRPFGGGGNQLNLFA